MKMILAYNYPSLTLLVFVEIMFAIVGLLCIGGFLQSIKRQQQDKPKMNKEGIFVNLFLIFICIGIMAFAAVEYHRNYTWENNFRSHINDYISINSATIEPALNIRSDTRKIVVIKKSGDIKGKTEELEKKIYYKLPKELRAQSHEDVNIVIWLEWEVERVGVYGSVNTAFPPKAYRVYCDVSVIDWENRILIDKRTFTGGAPPKSTKRRSRYGKLPIKAIVKFIKSLSSNTPFEPNSL